MASDDEQQSERLTRTLSDPAFPGHQQHLKSASNSLDYPHRQTPSSARDVFEGTTSGQGSGARGGGGGGGGGGAGLKTAKHPGWGRKSARGLFFRSGSPKTQDGEGPPDVTMPGGPSAGARMKGAAAGAPPTAGRPQRTKPDST